MKSNLLQILCSLNKNDSLSMVLIQKIKIITEKFNIFITVKISIIENFFTLTPVDKDGKPQKQITIITDKKFYVLKAKNRNLYLILLMAKILYNVDTKIYDYYSFVYNNEYQYVNLLLLLSQSKKNLTSMENNRNLFNEIIDKHVINSLIINQYNLKINVQEVELILSDDLYYYIGYRVINEAYRALKKPYENKTLYGYLLKISIDKDSYLEYFRIRINGYDIYHNTIILDMLPAFYLSLHLFEPLTYARCFKNSYSHIDTLKKGYAILDYPAFIQLVFKRLFQAIDLFNSSDNLVSPMWLRTQFECNALLNTKMKYGTLHASK
jgi:hypothetical protein